MKQNSYELGFLHGLAEKHQKRDIRSKLKLLYNLYNSPEELRAYRKAQLYKVLDIAAKEVPYYRDLFKKINFDPETIKKDTKYLQDIPFLTKDIIRKEGNRLLNQSLMKGKRHLRKTGGSTGATTPIYYDQEALDWTAATNLFAIGMTGRRHRDKEVHISSEFMTEIPFKAKVIENLKCMAMNRTNMSTSSLDDKCLNELWTKLKKAKPYIVQCHPSTLYALALFVESKYGPGQKCFKAFESTGEGIDYKKVKKIESVLGCNVYNRYGSAEFGVVAHSEDSFDRLKVLEHVGFISSCPLEEIHKEIIFTGIQNHLMPLINYRTGDLGTVINLNGSDYITNIEGRVHDTLVLEGKVIPTHFIQDCLDRSGQVSEFQIVQKSDGIIFKIVPEERHDKALLQKTVKDIVGDCEVEFTNMSGLTYQGWREKFRYIVKAG